MAKVGKISVIKKEYSQNFKTFDSSLSNTGYTRSPGTSRTFLPHKERNNQYRTGLDVSAQYLKKLSPEDYKLEVKRISEDKKRLEASLGLPDSGILDSGSPFWNYAASPKILIEKFNTDVRIEPVKLSNGDELFDFGNAMREIQFNFMKVHPQIAPSLEAFQRGDCNPEAQYYIADEDSESRAIYSRKKQINQAIGKFDSLVPSVKRQVARLMGLPITDDSKEEVVYNLIDSKLKETEFKEGQYKGMSTVTVFNDIVNLKDATREVKDLIEQAIRYSIYRISINGKVVEGSVDVAASKEGLVEYLLDDKNQTDLLVLIKKLKQA